MAAVRTEQLHLLQETLGEVKDQHSARRWKERSEGMY